MDNPLIKIVVTGPESTGKTEISMHLSSLLGEKYIPEYARSYVEQLDRRYTYEDVEHIASVQLKQLKDAERDTNQVIILDTFLIITKVWFQEVFKRVPDWITPVLKDSGIDLFLLCNIDLKWVEDPVRENPGSRRAYLFERYMNELEELGVPWEIVRGRGTERNVNAQKAILRHFHYLHNRIK
ncbi:MAG TPA: ATPase [Bacteroides sp.]|nr:ATPase [Bacteroides sp.]